MFTTGTSSADRTLKKPLGSWLLPWHQMRRDWPFLLDHSNDNRDPDQNIIDPTIPASAIPVDVVTLQMTYSVKHGYAQSAAPSNQEEAPLESVFDSLPKLDFWEM
jgi:hypothetical protein